MTKNHSYKLPLLDAAFDAALAVASSALALDRAKREPERCVNPALAARRVEAARLVNCLRRSSASRVVRGVADRIERCNDLDNLWTATDLHDVETGELFDARGSLWACNSRLCPSCVARRARQNRRTMRRVMEAEQLLVGTDWRFITLTLPDLALTELDLISVRSVIYEAWRKFSRSRWFERNIFGGAKSEEFTLGNFEQIHYHLHLLTISKYLDADELRLQWTKALLFSFKKHNLEFVCNSADGLAVCHIAKVTDQKKSVLEICKYITKSDSWAKIPLEQLADIAAVKRLPRMFELFGQCKQTARALTENERTGGSYTRQTPVNQNQTTPESIYLDTKCLTVNFPGVQTIEPQTATESPPKKQKTWRELCRVLPRKDWLKHLDKQIETCREYRKQQLRRKYAFSTFQTLSGESF